jgi:hypothetical protein
MQALLEKIQRETAKCVDRECVGRESCVGGAGHGSAKEDVERAQRARWGLRRNMGHVLGLLEWGKSDRAMKRNGDEDGSTTTTTSEVSNDADEDEAQLPQCNTHTSQNNHPLRPDLLYVAGDSNQKRCFAIYDGHIPTPTRPPSHAPLQYTQAVSGSEKFSPSTDQHIESISYPIPYLPPQFNDQGSRVTGPRRLTPLNYMFCDHGNTEYIRRVLDWRNRERGLLEMEICCNVPP